MSYFRSRWLFGLTLAVIVGIALSLRFYRFALPGSRADPAAPLATLPPGLDSDEAFHTLAALQLTRGEVAPFFKIDQGLPAAMIYLTALIIQLTSPVAEAGRLASAVAGLAVVITLIVIALHLFPDHPIAVIAVAAHVAFIFWFVNFSRIGLEQMVCALLVAVALLAFTHWRKRDDLPGAVVSGVTLGLALYSYAAAYFTPLVIFVCLVHNLFIAEPRARLNWPNLFAFLFAFVLVAAPLVYFFIQNPDWATGRIIQTAGTFDLPGALASLFIRGDAIARHNIPGRPLLDPVQTLFFVVGLMVCLRRWRDPAYVLPLVWLATMILPPALSANPAHFGRLAGALGALTLICGIGAIPLWKYLPRWLAVPLVAVALTYSAARTTYDYFVLWPQTPGYLRVFNFYERLQAEAIAALPPESPAYLTPSDRNRPMFAYLWGNPERVQSFNGRVCTVFPEHAERETVYLVNTLEDAHTPATLKAFFPAIRSRTLFVENGASVIEQLSILGAADAPTNLPVGRMGDFAELIAAHTLETPTPGRMLPVRLFWRVVGQTSGDWTVGLYLLDANTQVRAQDDRRPCDNSYPTSTWQLGEIIDEERSLNLPPDLPPGEYTLAIAFYRLADGERLPALAADGALDTLLRIITLSIP